MMSFILSVLKIKIPDIIKTINNKIIIMMNFILNFYY